MSPRTDVGTYSPADEARAEELRQSLPALQKTPAYLNTGTFGPVPSMAADAMTEQLESELNEGRIGAAPAERSGEIRQKARKALASALGAPAHRIALTHHTTDGLNIALHGFSWQPGDEIITTNLEHPGLLTPLAVLARRRGIQVRVADAGYGAPDQVMAAVRSCLTPRTRMVALSHVFWSTGAVAPVQELAHWARENHLLTVVDGAQSAGVFHLNLDDTEVDVYAAPGQKWLLGPEGTGGAYFSRRALEYVEPTFAGYLTAEARTERDPFFIPSAGAARYEIGGMHQPSLAGLAAAVNWLTDEVGLHWIEGRINYLARQAAEKWSAVPGVKVLTPEVDPAGPRSGLVSLAIHGRDDEDAARELSERGLQARFVPAAPGGVRISLGFYNLMAEVEAVAEALTEMAAEPRPGNGG